MQSSYLFGYGTLISSASRAKTSSTSEGRPVTVSGVQRFWGAYRPQHRLCAVNLRYLDGAKTNGVIVGLEGASLERFDERESVYERCELSWDALSEVPPDIDTSRTLWTYMAKPDEEHRHNYRIAQSYVDVMLDGCLRISDRFARDFVSQTGNWDIEWVNDRENPRYPRPLTDISLREQIDLVLKELLSKG